jgi:hypothetical protein
MAMKLKCCFCGGIGHEIKQCNSFGEVKKVLLKLPELPSSLLTHRIPIPRKRVPCSSGRAPRF